MNVANSVRICDFFTAWVKAGSLMEEPTAVEMRYFHCRDFVTYIWHITWFYFCRGFLFNLSFRSIVGQFWRHKYEAITKVRFNSITTFISVTAYLHWRRHDAVLHTGRIGGNSPRGGSTLGITRDAFPSDLFLLGVFQGLLSPSRYIRRAPVWKTGIFLHP